MSEHSEQCALFEWARLATFQYPELRYMFAIPNGGHRNKATAMRLKEEGVQPGVPDVFLPVPRGGFAGLWVEMKYGNNKPTEHQVRWLDWLEGQGFKTVVCWGWQVAKAEIERYLAL